VFLYLPSKEGGARRRRDGWGWLKIKIPARLRRRPEPTRVVSPDVV